MRVKAHMRSLWVTTGMFSVIPFFLITDFLGKTERITICRKFFAELKELMILRRCSWQKEFLGLPRSSLTHIFEVQLDLYYNL